MAKLMIFEKQKKERERESMLEVGEVRQAHPAVPHNQQAVIWSHGSGVVRGSLLSCSPR